MRTPTLWRRAYCLSIVCLPTPSHCRLDATRPALGELGMLTLITEALGPGVWKNTMAVLTHAHAARHAFGAQYEINSRQRRNIVTQLLRQVLLSIGGTFALSNCATLWFTRGGGRASSRARDAGGGMCALCHCGSIIAVLSECTACTACVYTAHACLAFEGSDRPWIARLRIWRRLSGVCSLLGLDECLSCIISPYGICAMSVECGVYSRVHGFW